MESRGIAGVVPVIKNIEVDDFFVEAINLQHTAAAYLAIVVGNLQQHQAAIGAEVRHIKTVEKNILPVARTPRMVAPTIAVDWPVGVAQRNPTRDPGMLIEVTQREITPVQPRRGGVQRNAAVGGRSGHVFPAHTGRQALRLRKQAFGMA